MENQLAQAHARQEQSDAKLAQSEAQLAMVSQQLQQLRLAQQNASLAPPVSPSAALQPPPGRAVGPSAAELALQSQVKQLISQKEAAEQV